MVRQADTITVKFQEYSENPEIAGILRALDASQVTATLRADSLDATYHELWMVECKGSGFLPPDGKRNTISQITYTVKRYR